MDAFSTHQHHFLLDSVFFPNPPIKTSSSSMDQLEHIIFNSSQNINFDPTINEVHGHSSQSLPVSPSFTQKQSTHSSSSSESCELLTHKVRPMPKKRRDIHGSSFTSSNSKEEMVESKCRKQRKLQANNRSEEGDEKFNSSVKKDEESPPTGYIHVRARRGQATDSHSLAERVRREKISERMKMLQQLVPGCDQITGKALMLDAIINYVQSLQTQVEYLSSKLASVSPMFYEFGMDIAGSFVGTSQASQLQFIPQSSEFVDTQTINPHHISPFTTTTTSCYPLFHEYSTSLFPQHQEERPLSFLDNVNRTWNGKEEERQEKIISTGFSDNLYFFH